MKNAVPRLVCSALLVLCATTHPALADSWSGRDKALHFTGTFVLSASAYALGAGLGRSRDLGAIAGATAGLGAGALKELLDLAGAGQPSAKDFAWSAAGTAMGMLVAFLLDLAMNGWTATPRPR